jgi:pimeloyl-ACP methyl ester carboxylesterase
MSDDAPWRALYPFESHELSLDGHRYHYLDEGCGETLLLVHGNPTWSFYWRNLVSALRDRYRVIVPDHIGCGLSDKPRQYPYQLDQHIANLRQLVTKLNLEQVTLIGHDWGGAIGLGVATSMPERFQRFIMFNTAAFRSSWMPWRIRICRTPVLGQVAVQGFNLFARSALWMALERPEHMPTLARRGLLAPYDTWSNRQAIYRFIQDIPMSESHPSYETLAEIENRLPLLKQHPWMFIWGMRDWCFKPKFLERFLDFFPKAEVHRLADAGHYVLEDAHEVIVPLVEQFLANNPLAQASIE